MLYPKQALLLSLAAATSASSAASAPSQRELQASVMCIAGGGEFIDCCPSKDPDDGVCTLLWCIDVDEVSVRDGCACDEIETACDQVGLLGAAVAGVPELCDKVDECCESSETSNGDFNACLGGAVDDGSIEVPDFAGMLPGGLPDIASIMEEMGGMPGVQLPGNVMDGVTEAIGGMPGVQLPGNVTLDDVHTGVPTTGDDMDHGDDHDDEDDHDGEDDHSDHDHGDDGDDHDDEEDHDDHDHGDDGMDKSTEDTDGSSGFAARGTRVVVAALAVVAGATIAVA